MNNSTRRPRRVLLGGLGAGTTAAGVGEVLVPGHTGSWQLDVAFVVQLLLFVVVTLTSNRSAYRDDETRREAESRRSRLYLELAEHMRVGREMLGEAMAGDDELRRWERTQEKAWQLLDRHLGDGEDTLAGAPRTLDTPTQEEVKPKQHIPG